MSKSRLLDSVVSIVIFQGSAESGHSLELVVWIEGGPLRMGYADFLIQLQVW